MNAALNGGILGGIGGGVLGGAGGYLAAPEGSDRAAAARRGMARGATLGAGVGAGSLMVARSGMTNRGGQYLVRDPELAALGGAGLLASPLVGGGAGIQAGAQVPKQASLDRGGYQEEDKPLDDSRLEREAAFRDSLQDAARAKGERMHGASAMSGMPNSGSATTPSIPGY